MDTWLTNDVKELLFKPCLEASGYIGNRLDNRLKMAQSIDERALTEDFVDLFDSSSSISAWSKVSQLLRDHQIYLNTNVKKSTVEHKTGADIGLIIQRGIYQKNTKSKTRYAVLIQCKKIDENGHVNDFFHKVNSSGKTQSSLMLDITPNSFYFIFTPPSLIKTYHSIEPIAFASTSPGCSSPLWNMGCFGFESGTFPFLNSQQKAEVTGILVIPALAVEAHENTSNKASLENILSNSMPLWYWFGELLIPGFIGDNTKETLAVASNQQGIEFGVKYSIEINYGNG